jgi:hypothetical protein
MFEWLRRLKRKWRRARGQKLFERLCASRDPLQRQLLRMELQHLAVPRDAQGWSRLWIEILKALSRGVSPSTAPGRLEAAFNWFFKEFAVTYPGLVPNNLPATELTAFAAQVAVKARQTGPWRAGDS